jgi:hypothetical protein
MHKSVLALSLALPVLAGSTTSAVATNNNRCDRVQGTIEASAVTQGCTSPVQLCTAGNFRGNNLLKGSTKFVADGLAQHAGMPTAEAATTLSYTGTITITARRGTLTVRDTGIFDPPRGLFASRSVVTGGTGVFAGATGWLLIGGTGSSSFEALVGGEICLR